MNDRQSLHKKLEHASKFRHPDLKDDDSVLWKADRGLAITEKRVGKCKAKDNILLYEGILECAHTKIKNLIKIRSRRERKRSVSNVDD